RRLLPPLRIRHRRRGRGDPRGPPARLARRAPGVRPMSVLRKATPIVCAASLGVLSAVLISCGSSSRGLIPTANAGPLRSDFEAVALAAQSANGNCSPTETALAKTQQD